MTLVFLPFGLLGALDMLQVVHQQVCRLLRGLFGATVVMVHKTNVPAQQHALPAFKREPTAHPLPFVRRGLAMERRSTSGL